MFEYIEDDAIETFDELANRGICLSPLLFVMAFL